MTTTTAPVLSLRQSWLALGQVPVPADAIEPGLWEEVQLEADQHRQVAVVRHNQRPGLLAMRDGSITSPQKCKVHPGGPALNALARHKALADIASEALGRPRLTPIRYGYKYYAAGDYMHLHRDDGKCGITFSCGLTPGLAPMGWQPNLRYESTAAVAERYADTPYPEGPALPVLHRQFTGFDGRRIPHWRAPLPEGASEVLITICFTDLSV